VSGGKQGDGLGRGESTCVTYAENVEGAGCPVWFSTQENGSGWCLDLDEDLRTICEMPVPDFGTVRPDGWTRPSWATIGPLYSDWRSSRG
jgi:hypothetical protein